jgi:hypothetical protein
MLGQLEVIVAVVGQEESVCVCVCVRKCSRIVVGEGKGKVVLVHN